MRKSPFFDALNRRPEVGFETLLAEGEDEVDYIDWNGSLLAQHYGDAGYEYRAIRQECALFDVSPLRKCRIRGADAGEFLDHLLTRPVSGSADGRGQYVIFCNEDGTLKDDAILHRYSADDYLLMPSDVDHRPHFRGLRSELGLERLSFDEQSLDWAGFALQGPLSAAAMVAMGFEGAEQLEPMQIRDFEVEEGFVRVSRMGFTADLGYECWLKINQRAAMVQRFEQARQLTGLDIPGYGLMALEACRLEGGFIVAGWDCATEVDPQPGFERSPLELGLSWLVDLDNRNFIGREALRQQKAAGARYQHRTFRLDGRRTIEAGTPVFTEAGLAVGTINCAAWSETLGATIGNASLDLTTRQGVNQLSTAWIDQGGERLNLSLARGPWLKPSRARQVPAPLDYVALDGIKTGNES